MQVEAFPEPIRYWEKIPDNRLIEQSEFDAKYNIETVHSDMWVETLKFYDDDSFPQAALKVMSTFPSLAVPFQLEFISVPRFYGAIFLWCSRTFLPSLHATST